MGHSTYTQRSILYTAVNLYNKLPKNLTLIKEQHIFKKWIKKYNMDNNIKIKSQEDNVKIIINQDYCQENIRKCQEENIEEERRLN